MTLTTTEDISKILAFGEDDTDESGLDEEKEDNLGEMDDEEKENEEGEGTEEEDEFEREDADEDEEE